MDVRYPVFAGFAGIYQYRLIRLSVNRTRTSEFGRSKRKTNEDYSVFSGNLPGSARMGPANHTIAKTTKTQLHHFEKHFIDGASVTNYEANFKSSSTFQGPP